MFAIKIKKLFSGTILSKSTRQLFCDISVGLLWIANTSCMVLILPLCYSGLQHERGIKTIQEELAIHRSPLEISQNSFLVDLLKIVPENNFFDFNGNHFHQLLTFNLHKTRLLVGL